MPHRIVGVSHVRTSGRTALGRALMPACGRAAIQRVVASRH